VAAQLREEHQRNERNTTVILQAIRARSALIAGGVATSTIARMRDVKEEKRGSWSSTIHAWPEVALQGASWLYVQPLFSSFSTHTGSTRAFHRRESHLA